MARIRTNEVSIAYAIEASLATLPVTPAWVLLEPNGISAFGADTTKTPRDPISANRQRRKGTTTDLDSSAEFDADITMDHINDFAEGFVFSAAIGTRIQAGSEFESLVAGAATYTHDTLAAALAEDTLVYARGFSTAVNNGLGVVDTGATTTATPIKSGTQVTETPAQTTGATLEVVGVRGATADITWTFSTLTLGSTTLDFTTLGLTPGQEIHIGGDATANKFAEGTALARIVSIAANAIVVDKVVDIDAGTLSTTDGTAAAKDIDILFGRFVRNVATTSAEFLEQTFQFQLTEPNGGGVGVDQYEYSKGNLCNTAAFELPLTDKATVTFGFVGTDTDVPTTTPATGGTTPVDPVATGAFNTTSGIAQLQLTGTSDLGACFKSLTLTLNNNVSPEKCLGTLGATFMNFGNFEVDFEAELIFTEGALITAIRNNETVTLAFTLVNDDGGFTTDLPSLTLGGGGRTFPRNESVLVSTTGEAFQDALLGTSIGLSTFPYLPSDTINN